MPDIPVYVVPDDQMPRYGEEAGPKMWQEQLGNLLGAIQSYRQQVPVYMPFKPRTPTLQKQAQDWARTVQEAGLTGYYQGKPTWEREYAERQLALRQATAGPKMTAGEARDLTYGEYAQRLKDMVDEAWRTGGWAAAVEIIPRLEAKIRTDSPELMKAQVNPEELVDYIYDLIGGFTKQSGVRVHPYLTKDKSGKWVPKEAAGTGGTERGLL